MRIKFVQRPTIQNRIAEVRKGLKGISLDTAWIINPENRRYLSGYDAMDTHFTESSGSLLIGSNRLLLIVDSRYTTHAEDQVPDFEIHTLKKGFADEFPAVVKQTATNNLGFEQGYVTWGLYNELSRSFDAFSPPVHLRPLDGMVEDMREVKDEEEIDALERSAKLICYVLDEVIDTLDPGLTEREVAWRIESLARESGADGLAFPSIVASGPNSALPHAVPTDRRLGQGEPIIFDVGVQLDGYCSDMTRTVFLGEPREDFKKIYATVRRAQLEALEEIRPGVESNHPDSVARGIIRDAGFGRCFGHGLGHGVGLATHEGPRLSPLKPKKLKKGMVVTVEPGIYIPGMGGVRLEEMVVIEQGGARILTECDHFYDFTS
jgi:Xaa-Pro aminopeptidase